MSWFSDFLTDVSGPIGRSAQAGMINQENRKRNLSDQLQSFNQMMGPKLEFIKKQHDMSRQLEQERSAPVVEAFNTAMKGSPAEYTATPQGAPGEFNPEQSGRMTKPAVEPGSPEAVKGMLPALVKAYPEKVIPSFLQQFMPKPSTPHIVGENARGVYDNGKLIEFAPQANGIVSPPVAGPNQSMTQNFDKNGRPKGWSVRDVKEVTQKMDPNVAARIINDTTSSPEHVTLAKNFLGTLRDFGAEKTGANKEAGITTENKLLDVITNMTREKTLASTQANIDANTNAANVAKLAAAAQARAAAIQKGQSVTLPPESLDYFAKSYLTPGNPSFGRIPNFGMGQAGMAARAQLMIRVGEMGQMSGNDPEGLAVKSAAFTGLKTELTNMSSQKGKIMNFMLTNDKNLALAEKISDAVERSDIPALNNLLIPYRMKVGGEGDVAALNAAIRVAINETAKVLTSATGAGVISDASRKEMEQTLNTSMNPKQVRSVIAVLRRDMENRASSYDELGKQILGQMQTLGHGQFTNEQHTLPKPGKPTPTNDPLEGKTATGPGGVKIIRRNGAWVPYGQ